MSADEARSGDSEQRQREKREAEERETETHAPADRSGDEDPTEESTLESVPAARANKPTG